MLKLKLVQLKRWLILKLGQLKLMLNLML